MRPFQFHLKDHQSSVAGQPPSLDRNDFCSPRLVAEPHKCYERCRPSSQRPQHPTLYRHLKRRLGRSLRLKFYKGSVVRRGKKATHKCSKAESGLPGPFATDNSTVVAYINKEGGTHSAEMWKIMTWCH